MTRHSRYAFVLMLLGSVSVLGIEAAQAEKPKISFSQFAPSAPRAIPNVTPKITRKLQPNIVRAKPAFVPKVAVPKVTPKIKPKVANVAPPKLNPKFLPADQLDLGKLKSRASKRNQSPSNANTPIAGPNVANILRGPKLKSPKLNADVPTGGVVALPNNPAKPSGVNQGGAAGAAGARKTPQLPLPAEPPFNDNLGDAITVTGGTPDWWKAFENWSDIANAGPGEFQPGFLRGAPKQPPEIDLNPFGPDRPEDPKKPASARRDGRATAGTLLDSTIRQAKRRMRERTPTPITIWNAANGPT